LVLTIAACTGSGAVSQTSATTALRGPATDTSELVEIDDRPDPTDVGWALVSGSLDGSPVPIVQGHPITLTLDRGLAMGHAACNGYSAPYSLSTTTLTFIEISVEEARCPDRLTESYFSYAEALDRVETYAMTESKLTLRGEGAELVFSALPHRPPDDLTGVPWQLVSGRVDGSAIPLVEGYPITMTLFEAELAGRAACNEYFVTLSRSGSTIDLAPEWSSTAMGCSPEAVMESERSYLDALLQVDTLTTDSGTLTLSDGSSVELNFVALPPAPIADLTGSVWVLTRLIDGDSVSNAAGDRATLELYTDGSMLGSTGCRTLHGS
jgi:heat shock protein HslJ